MTIAPLSREELRSIFDESIRSDLDVLLGQASNSHSPTLHLVGGQPGAGKTQAVASIARENPGAVEVIGDDLRAFHPEYVSLLEADPLHMPIETAAASAAWVEMSIDYLLRQGASVILETTLRQTAVVLATLERFSNSGYRTELRVLAVPLEQSRLGVLSRYLAQVEMTGTGRWVPAAIHDEAAMNLPDTVRSAIGSGFLHGLLVQDRDGAVLFARDFERGCSPGDVEGAIQSIDAARSGAYVTVPSARAWLAQLRNNIDGLVAADAPDPQVMTAIDRLVAIDSPLIARAAYPHDALFARDVVKSLSVRLDNARPSTTLDEGVNDAGDAS